MAMTAVDVEGGDGMNRWSGRIVSVGLAAAVLGLVTSPILFVFLALGEFRGSVLAIALPTLFLSMGFLPSYAQVLAGHERRTCPPGASSR